MAVLWMLGLLLASCSGGGRQSSQHVGAFDPKRFEVHGDALTLKTDSGPVRGTQQGPVRRFLGIPYAAPPVGQLRFAAARPHAPWSEPLDASRAGNECVQLVPIINQVTGNEDCLFANVFTPAPPPSKPKPVMVWIHGGGFAVGSGMDDDPTRIVAQSGVVAVTFNYRLGPFGFLALPALRGADSRHAEGTVGIEDQQAVLRWVHDNIAAFGGDPGDVTIFGESAGGVSVCVQLMSPLASGLFEKAITESGPCVGSLQLTRAAAEHQAGEVADKAGCGASADVIACLRAKPARDVLLAVPPTTTDVFNSSAFFGPTGDDVVLPSDPQAALETGRFNRVPVIVGANRDEGRLFAGLDFNAVGPALTASQYEPAVARLVGPALASRVVAEYPLAQYPDPGAALGEAIGDAGLLCPAVRSADLLAAHVPVFLYEYDHTPNPFILPMPGIDLGAFHSAELPYVFGGSVSSSGAIAFTPAEQRLSDMVVAAWSRFAGSGDPATSPLSWPRLDPQRPRYLSLDTPPTVKTGPMKQAACAFWASVPSGR